MKHIGILAFAKFQGFFGGLIGVAAGVFYSVGGFIIDSLVSLGWIDTPSTPGLSTGTILAFLALFGMPIIFAFFGFILGIAGAILFNIATRIFGKINIDFK
ncbi:hypothetical protein [Christiangramia salexigens]|uniref:DUF3566 domain-containing protein n=1 Tax=Christiangramia salexigens TaxID=1913577 RepID=A0A1L3J439_9FLAO|nr:hypothetical protein [Christiangramia salexigens]APG59909.1 hypothetical protein LPB144_05545 [Christiangramia salexigens]